MSIINQMLKDLESRKSQSNESKSVLHGLTAGILTNNEPFNIKRWSFILTGYFILLLIINFAGPDKEDYMIFQTDIKAPEGQPVIDDNTRAMFNAITTPGEGLTDRRQTTAESTSSTSVSSPLLQEPPAEVAASVSAQSDLQTLNSIEAKMTDGAMRLAFHLTAENKYEMVLDDKRNILTLTFPHMQFNTDELPVLGENQYLENINTIQNGETLQVKLHLKPGVQAVDVAYLVTTQEPILVMELVHDAYAQTANTSSPSSINKVMVPLNEDQKAEISLQKALTLLQNENLAAAETLMKDTVNAYPSYRPAREALVSMYLEQGNLGAAQSTLSTGLSTSPRYVPFVVLQARIYMEQGSLVEADNLLETVSPELANNTDYFAMKANLAQQQGRHDVAEQIYADLLKHDPSNGVWWVGYGVSLEGNEKINAALVAYQRAMLTTSLSGPLRSYTGERISALGG